MQKKYIVIGICAVLAIIIGGFVIFGNKPQPSPEVKQIIIPMSIEDFKDDPNLDKAVKDQLEGRPATQVPSADIGSQLQPTTQGVQ